MNQFWPITTEPLPKANAPPDSESSDYRVIFHLVSFGRVQAHIKQGSFIIDILSGHNFEEVYNLVSQEYPQASWNPLENR